MPAWNKGVAMYKAAVCVVTGCFALPLHAQQPRNQFADVPETLQLTLVTDQIVKPAYAISPPGDVLRVFVIEPWDDNAKGWIRLIKDGSFVPQPFLEISPVSQGFTTGLLCVAFDSNYATNGFFYVTYTDQATNNFKVSRFQGRNRLDRRPGAGNGRVVGDASKQCGPSQFKAVGDRP